MKKLLALVMILLLLIPLARTVFAAPARVPQASSTNIPTQVTRLPFQGTIQSTQNSVTVFPITSVSATGSGNATQVGTFTVSYQAEISLLDLSVTELARFTSVNGDSLEADAVGQATEDRTPGMLNFVEIYRITGGTGPYAGASGTFTLHRLANVPGGAAYSTFEGYILIPWKE